MKDASVSPLSVAEHLGHEKHATSLARRLVEPATGAATASEPAPAMFVGVARLKGRMDPVETRLYSAPRAFRVLANWPRATSARRVTPTLPLGWPLRSATSLAVARPRDLTASSTRTSRSDAGAAVVLDVVVAGTAAEDESTGTTLGRIRRVAG